MNRQNFILKSSFNLLIVIISFCSFSYPERNVKTYNQIDNRGELKKALLKKVDLMGIPFSNKQKEIWVECVISKGKRLNRKLSSVEATKIYVECGDEIVNTQKLNGWNITFEKNYIFHLSRNTRKKQTTLRGLKKLQTA